MIKGKKAIKSVKKIESKLKLVRRKTGSGQFKIYFTILNSFYSVITLYG